MIKGATCSETETKIGLSRPVPRPNKTEAGPVVDGVGISLILAAVVSDKLGDLGIEAAEAASERSNLSKMRVLFLNELYKLPFLLAIGFIYERQQVDETFSSFDSVWSFLLGGCATLFLSTGCINLAVIIFGGMWTSIASSLELVVVFFASMVLFNAQATLMQLLGLFSLLMSVLTVNLMARKLEHLWKAAVLAHMEDLQMMVAVSGTGASDLRTMTAKTNVTLHEALDSFYGLKNRASRMIAHGSQRSKNLASLWTAHADSMVDRQSTMAAPLVLPLPTMANSE